MSTPVAGAGSRTPCGCRAVSASEKPDFQGRYLSPKGPSRIIASMIQRGEKSRPASRSAFRTQVATRLFRNGMPIASDSSAKISHSLFASPCAGTSGSVHCAYGSVMSWVWKIGKSSRSKYVVHGST